MENETKTAFGAQPLPPGMPEDPALSYDPSKTKMLRPAEAKPVATHTLAFGETDTEATHAIPSVAGRKAAQRTGPPFEFVRILGQGGFGVVWEGVQSSLRRVVALKKVRTDVLRSVEGDPDRGEALAEAFRAEAITSAQLDHPNIVPMYEMGTDEMGLPLLAMKRVEGRAWDGMLRADFAAMPVDDYLSKHIPILLDVAQAVAFAHSRGIVHRDLKPAQVMVGDFGEVLLMDWGLALAYDEELFRRGRRSDLLEGTPTCATADNPAGTPSYMAPEQTEPNAKNIGPWTDVYLLGGTLFTILTGSYPHPGRGTAAVMELARAGLVNDPHEAANGRPMPDELVALMQRCLAAEIGERPASAKEFVDALRDYLSGASRRRESEAIVRDVEARLKTGTREYEELNTCVGELGRARTMWSGNPHVGPLREEALLAFGRSALANGDYVLARVQAKRLEAGRERDALSADIGAAEARARAHARTRRVALVAVIALVAAIAAMTALFNRRLKREVTEKEAARTAAVDARKRAESARAETEDLLGFMLGDLKDRLEPVGRLDVMDTVLARVGEHLVSGGAASAPEEEQRARTYLAVSSVRLAQGNAREAEAAAARAQEIAARLATPKAPMLALSAEARLRRSDALQRLGEPEKARAAADEAIAMMEERAAESEELHWLAEGYNRRELFLADQGKLEEAAAANDAGRKLFEALAAKEPANRTWRRELAVNRNNLGNLRKRQGLADDMRRAYREALAMREALFAEEPANAAFQRDLSASHLNLAFLHASEKQFDEARAELEKALAIHGALSDSDPANLAWLSEYGVIFNHLGNVQRALGDLAASRASYERAVQLGERLTAMRPRNSAWQFDLAASRLGLGNVLRQLGEPDAARKSFETAAASLENLVASDPSNTQWQRALSMAKQNAEK